MEDIELIQAYNELINKCTLLNIQIPFEAEYVYENNALLIKKLNNDSVILGSKFTRISFHSYVFTQISCYGYKLIIKGKHILINDCVELTHYIKEGNLIIADKDLKVCVLKKAVAENLDYIRRYKSFDTLVMIQTKDSLQLLNEAKSCKELTELLDEVKNIIEFLIGGFSISTKKLLRLIDKYYEKEYKRNK